MLRTPGELIAYLEGLGIATETIEHPPLFTVEESRALRGDISGGHTKNLFLKDKKGRLFLVVAEEEAEIDLKALHRRIGCGRLSFGNAELLQSVLGVAPGAVTPFGAVNDTGRQVSVLIDAALMRHRRLNFHPLDNRATTNIAAEDLLAFLRATGHEPRIMPLSEEASQLAGAAQSPQTLSPAASSPHRRERASEGHEHER